MAAMEFIYLQGKCKWARLIQPDTQFGDSKWKITQYLNDESYNKVLKLKEPPAILNHIKKDEDGYYVNLSRKTQLNVKGKLVALPPPEILDGSQKLPDGSHPPLRDVLIGNGSDVTTKCQVYTYQLKTGQGKGRALRLVSVRVDNLIPFEVKRDFTDIQKDSIAGLNEQPAQLF